MLFLKCEAQWLLGSSGFVWRGAFVEGEGVSGFVWHWQSSDTRVRGQSGVGIGRRVVSIELFLGARYTMDLVGRGIGGSKWGGMSKRKL